ncbi:MAG: bifunctional 4-hydroxy-2-oxoglutarate aldolase/2-dehydro-3-deoxy-phosphogluconate aldolase [Catonella sp.]|uniref:bifunctional 4-hydroxy-2-oxoglutarate aldolase/2-dehydro-3-deoxy-phosphogluconate aldolase n=1 Tax=Catonella sp. TaxID=2382125 RepID=UPI003FA0918F
MSLYKIIENCGVIPVVVLEDAANAVPLAKALLAGGINICEITFRTEAAEESIRQIALNVPEMIVGAGTVLTKEQLKTATDAGAKFIVSPGSDLEVIRYAKELGVLMLPGAVTPTEIMQLIKEDIKVIKFFPADNYGGLKTIKALSAPFPNIKFVPTGGVSLSNLSTYLEFDKIAAVGGSWLCTKDLIKSNRWDEITKLSKEAMDIFKSVR